MTRIIIIDPANRTVEERELPPATDAHAEQIRKIIGDSFDVASFVIRRDECDNLLYVDDEGLFKKLSHFALPDWDSTQSYAGIGVIAGCNDNGETVSVTVTVEEIRVKIVFLE